MSSAEFGKFGNSHCLLLNNQYFYLMKKLFLFSCICFLLFSCRQRKENKPAAAFTEQNSAETYLPKGFKNSKNSIVQYPAPGGLVTDFAAVFSAAEIHELDSLIKAFEKATTNQVAIVIFDTIPVLKEEFDAYSLGLANNWGVGQKEKNNGILIALCTSMRRIRIHNGFGITEKLTDTATKKIIDSAIIPDLKKAGYFSGVKKGLLSIMAKLQ